MWDVAGRFVNSPKAGLFSVSPSVSFGVEGGGCWESTHAHTRLRASLAEVSLLVVRWPFERAGCCTNEYRPERSSLTSPAVPKTPRKHGGMISYRGRGGRAWQNSQNDTMLDPWSKWKANQWGMIFQDKCKRVSIQYDNTGYSYDIYEKRFIFLLFVFFFFLLGFSIPPCLGLENGHGTCSGVSILVCSRVHPCMHIISYEVLKSTCPRYFPPLRELVDCLFSYCCPWYDIIVYDMVNRYVDNAFGQGRTTNTAVIQQCRQSSALRNTTTRRYVYN